jgi:AcrR family transcriptional regulator
MAATTRTLSTADQRREDILVAAERVFAARGYHGTPTTEIAKAAGISQAYLFRLFPTKRELFRALAERCFARLADGFARAAATARTDGGEVDGGEVLVAMGNAYSALLADRDQLLLQLQTFAAANEPEIREVTRNGFRMLFELVQRESGASDEELRAWFGVGMLMNVLAAMGADEVDAPWAHALMPPNC